MPLGVIHPIAVHLHIALFIMGFISMYYWFLKGLATSVFEDGFHNLAHHNTFAGVLFLIVAMIAGIRDGLLGIYVSFSSPTGFWLYVKVVLASLTLLVYLLFLHFSNQRRRYLQEDTRLMLWCLATQGVGFLLVVAITTIGTLIVYYPYLLID
jgi:uncharacterized membrane protein